MAGAHAADSHVPAFYVAYAYVAHAAMALSIHCRVEHIDRRPVSRPVYLG